MKVALVTGVAGFVGSAVARAFLDAGLAVVGVDAMRDVYDPALKQQNLRPLLEHPHFAFHERDLARDAIDDLLRGVDVVSHQAGRAGLRDSWGGDFASYLTDNVSATQRLLDAVLTSGRISRVVLASSSSLYGDATAFPTREDAVPAPLSPYGVTKLAAERLAVAYASVHAVPVVCLRYFSVFGPGQRPDMAFTRMIDAVTGGPAFTLLGTGEQIRDFTFVGDVAAANLACLAADVVPGTVLNIAGGAQASVLDALDAVAQVAGVLVPVEHFARADGEARRTSGDITLARELLGWSPSTGLVEGIAMQYQTHLASVGELRGA